MIGFNFDLNVSVFGIFFFCFIIMCVLYVDSGVKLNFYLYVYCFVFFFVFLWLDVDNFILEVLLVFENIILV